MDPRDCSVLVKDHNGNTLGHMTVDVLPSRITGASVRERSDREGVVLTLELAEGLEDATEGVCRHCSRRILEESEGSWVDPEASGDDSVWRETCDAHDTFTAEHEPTA